MKFTSSKRREGIMCPQPGFGRSRQPPPHLPQPLAVHLRRLPAEPPWIPTPQATQRMRGGQHRKFPGPRARVNGKGTHFPAGMWPSEKQVVRAAHGTGPKIPQGVQKMTDLHHLLLARRKARVTAKEKVKARARTMAKVTGKAKAKEREDEARVMRHPQGTARLTQTGAPRVRGKNGTQRILFSFALGTKGPRPQGGASKYPRLQLRHK